MKVTVSKNDLKEALSKASSTLGKGEDITSHFLLKIKNETQCDVLSCDPPRMFSITPLAGVKCEGEGQFTIDGKRLLQAINSIEGVIEISYTEGDISFKSSKGELSFSSLNPDNFPPWENLLSESEVANEDGNFTTNVMSDTLLNLKPYCSQNEQRQPELCMILFKEGKAFACDGFGLGMAKSEDFDDVELKIHYKDIVKEKKTKPIKVIHNAYDFQISLTKDKKLIKTELNVTDSNFIIVMIARLDPWKDFQTLLSVAEIVIKSYNSVVFYLIGDGQLKREINNEITKRELNDNVILTGEKKDIHNYINICNISVLSTHGEGSSNAIIESMACGKPIIATDVGGNSEIIGTDGKCGILIPPESPAEFSKAVISLIRDDIKLKNMGKAAQKRIQNLCNMEKYISSYENLFSSVYVKSGE